MVLSTTRRAQAKKALKEKKEEGAMEEEKVEGGDENKEEEVEVIDKTNTKDAQKEEAKKEEEAAKKAEEEKKKKEPEEEPTCVLKNPSRVLRIQERTIEYLEDNRYNAVLEVSSTDDNWERELRWLLFCSFCLIFRSKSQFFLRTEKGDTSFWLTPSLMNLRNLLTMSLWRPG